MRALLIAEKPSLMREIESVYKKVGFEDQIDFLALAGHILELKEPDEYTETWGKPWTENVLPMIPEKFDFKVTSEKRDLFQRVKTAVNSGKYDYLINACDAGREGNAIFKTVYMKLNCKLPIKRFWATDPSVASMSYALEHLIDGKDRRMVLLDASALYRMYFDWLLGMNLSRAASLRAKGTISVGRVMTPTLNIVVQRELEIRNFKPQDYWEIEGDFEKYKGIWYDPELKESKIRDMATATQVVERFPNEAIVENVDEKQDKELAPTLHSLLELQKEANKIYGYTLDDTLKIAQKLYEEHQLITYPRTSSRYLPTNLVDTIPKRIQTVASLSEVKDVANQILSKPARIKEVLGMKRYVDDAGITDHYAIIPTDRKADFSKLSEKERNVYLLVVKRLLAIFLPPYTVNKTTIFTRAGEDLFKTSGKVLVDLGYKALYKEDEKDVILPNLKKGDKIPALGTKLLKKQTVPPKRYDDAALAEAMKSAGKFIDDKDLKSVLRETEGLGTEATRADIVKKLVTKKMVERKGKFFYATDYGIQMIRILKDQDIVSPELTAIWEKKLGDIERDQYDPKTFYYEMLEYAKTTTQGYLGGISETIEQTTREVLGKCPLCGADVYEGKNFYVCSNYKNPCTLILPKEFGQAKITKMDVRRLLIGSTTPEKNFVWKSGKKGKATLALEEGRLKPVFGNPNTNPSSNENAASARNFAPESGVVLGKCPHCGEDVIEGKDFYLCKNYNKGCNFNVKKTINSATITPNVLKILIKGDISPALNFVWKNGKPGTAKLQYKEKKLNFIF